MDTRDFYHQLFGPLLSGGGSAVDLPAEVGPFDPMGDLALCRMSTRDGRFVPYVSVGLAVCPEQKPGRMGRYELLFSGDDEGWVREVASDIARMSFDIRFDGGHTFDLSSWAFETDTLQGVLFEEVYRVRIEGQAYGVLRGMGITRRELAFARIHGGRALLQRLKDAGVHPHCDARRRSVIDAGAELAPAPLPPGTVGSVQQHLVAGLDLSVIRQISGHQGISAVTVLGRDLDEMSSEALWFRLDVRLEDDIGLVQVLVPLEGEALGREAPRLKVAWHDGILFPPYDALLRDGATHPVPEAKALMAGLFAAHLERQRPTPPPQRRR